MKSNLNDLDQLRLKLLYKNIIINKFIREKFFDLLELVISNNIAYTDFLKLMKVNLDHQFNSNKEFLDELDLFWFESEWLYSPESALMDYNQLGCYKSRIYDFELKEYHLDKKRRKYHGLNRSKRVQPTTRIYSSRSRIINWKYRPQSERISGRIFSKS